MVDDEDDVLTLPAGGRLGALEVRAREGQRDEAHRRGAQQQEDDVAQPQPSPVALHDPLQEAQRPERDHALPQAEDQMDDDRHRHGAQRDQEERILETHVTRSRRR